MGKFVLIDARLFTGGADLSGNSNKLEISGSVEDKDTTNFRSAGWKEVLGGLAETEISGEGQWEASDASKVDDAMWAQLGGLTAWSACPVDSTLGALTYFTKAFTGAYALGGAVGDVAPWSGAAKGSWPLVRGVVAHPPGTPRTTTGVGTAVQLGAVPAGKSLYAALHVLSVAGTTPSITVRIEQDNAVGFPSAATSLTFDPATARGGQILRLAGPTTDDWFRPAWTISGTTPSFLFLVAFGVA